MAYKIVRQHGFSLVYSTESGRFNFNDKRQALIPRYNVNDEFVCSPRGEYSFPHFIWNLWRRDIFLFAGDRPMQGPSTDLISDRKLNLKNGKNYNFDYT
jgi:hypothetical protein